METTVEKLKESKVQTVTIVSKEEHAEAERGALQRLAAHIEIKGFRVGKAPEDTVRARVGQEALLEETVRLLLPKVLKEALEKSEAQPILRPAADIVSKDPLTIKLTFVNRPTVTVKKPESINVAKKTPEEVTEKDIDVFVKKVLLQDRTETPVEREAQKGDAIRFEMKTTTKKGEKIDELTVPGYGMLLGDEEFLPELEEHLIGMKKGDEKNVFVQFPKDHDIPGIRGQKVQIALSMKNVADVVIPELTTDYIKTRLQTEKTPEVLRGEIKQMLTSKRRDEEMRRREEEMFEAVRSATTVNLAPELIEAEVQDMVRDLHERLEQQGTNIQDWLKQTGKDEKSVVDEMRGIAQSRLVLRFGMQELAEKLNVEPNAENLGAALKAHKTQASAGETDTTPADFEKGGRIYENIRNELRMQALQERLMGS